jgi:methylated-DNA-protein-cysteine methyltransferase-like protein
MENSKSNFRERVYVVVAQIPYGRVMTYGQIAALCGNARAARIVGGVAHFGDPDMPWHRVVNRKGGMAAGYPGGRKAHQQHLENEEIEFTSEGCIANMQKILWYPEVS